MWFSRRNADQDLRIPEGWSPRVHRGGAFWFWVPGDWSRCDPLSPGSCLALRSPLVLAEVFALGIPPAMQNPASTSSGILKRSILESHPDARVLREGAYSAPPFDQTDALRRMEALGIMEGYGFVTEMSPPQSGHRFAVEYREPGGGQSATECFALYRPGSGSDKDLVLQLNMKTLRSEYKRQLPIFETVAAGAMLGRFA